MSAKNKTRAFLEGKPADFKPTAIQYLVFSIRDVKTNVFNTPYFQTSKAGAIRMFADLVNDHQSTVAKHPEDFQLYELGIFNSETAEMLSHAQPQFISNASEFVRQ